MAGKFMWKYFSDVNLDDPFFGTLKMDYNEFPVWFKRKSDEHERALVFKDEIGIGAFVYLKDEEEEIQLTDKTLPKMKRLKIGTLRLAERMRGIRLGEGALGVCLWNWQEKQYDEIYVTTFEKHEQLISLFTRFGFICVGKNPRGENVYLKSRKSLNYNDPYTSFPFICPNIKKAGIIPIEDHFHDALFPYSELKGNQLEIEEETAGNGITKVYIGSPYTVDHYKEGEPVFIYSIYTGPTGKTYRSVITSYCTITRVKIIKNNNVEVLTLPEFIKEAGNKTVFNKDELTRIYNSKRNIVLLEMVYNKFFGKGHNVTHKELNENDLFPAHPYNIDYSESDFRKILKMGDINVQNVIID
jgi:hypothetical protein